MAGKAFYVAVNGVTVTDGTAPSHEALRALNEILSKVMQEKRNDRNKEYLVELFIDRDVGGFYRAYGRFF